MKSSLYTLPLLSILVAAPVMAAETLEQESATQAYGSPEIEVAVEAARRFPVQAEYVGYEWYNRTTSKSFPQPKMLNTEMTDLVIEGAMGPTAAGTAAAEEASRPTRRVALGQSDEDEEIIETDENLQPSPRADVKRVREVFIKESRSSSASGEMITREARSFGTVSATAR